jgi:hypothetical protein
MQKCRRWVLTVFQSLLNLFTRGHDERTILDNSLIERLSRDLQIKMKFEMDNKLLEYTTTQLTITNSVLSSVAVRATPV